MPMRSLEKALGVLAMAALASGPMPQDGPKPAPTAFEFPCTGYMKAVNARGSFGHHVTSPGTPFHDSWHLGEDIWLPAGTEVRAIADGVVRYSAFSPTWTDEGGVVHWNLGNVIVIEHAIEPAEKEHGTLCSIYIHLASDRRVKVGDEVKRAAVIGRIGADKSEENGRYPAHLHFGLHLGPYIQIPPSLERELRAGASSKKGLVFGTTVLRGDLVLDRHGESDVLITAKESGEKALFSLLVGSTTPKDKPPDIAMWCQGYGDQRTMSEWLRPSQFLRKRGAK